MCRRNAIGLSEEAKKELKPCPFCGTENPEFDDYDVCFIIGCNNEECNAHVMSYGTVGAETIPDNEVDEVIKKVITSWNRRTN